MGATLRAPREGLARVSRRMRGELRRLPRAREDSHAARRLEVVRVLRQRLAAVLRDQEEVLEADAADALDALDARLDRDYVARDELALACQAESRGLVDFQPHAVAEAEVEAVAEPLARLARALGWIA